MDRIIVRLKTIEFKKKKFDIYFFIQILAFKLLAFKLYLLSHLLLKLIFNKPYLPKLSQILDPF